MQMTARWAGVLLVSVLGVGCLDSAAPARGTVDVTVESTGTDLDPDGYVVTLDSRQTQRVTLNSKTEFASVGAGKHWVTLANVSANCTVGHENPRPVTVPADASVTADFSVACSVRTGSVRLTTSTLGAALDADGYRLRIDDGTELAVATNGVAVLTQIHEGAHTLSLSDVASNCTLSGESQRTVNVGYADTTALQFSIACSTPRGTLIVTTTTTGLDLDADGYALSFGSDPWDYDWLYTISVPTNGTSVVRDVAGGSYTFDIGGVAPNCRVVNVDPPIFSIEHHLVTSVAVTVTCVARATAETRSRSRLSG